MIQAFCDWLAATSLSQLFASLDWFVPVVQTVHILAIAALVTVISMLSLRLLRLTQATSGLRTFAIDFLPWVWRAVVVLLVSGVVLIITEPARELMNDAFRIKILLVLMLIAVTLTLQSALRNRPDYWEANGGRPIMARALPLASLVLCVAIVAAGRLIAYV